MKNQAEIFMTSNAMSDLTYSVRLLTVGGWGLGEESGGNVQPGTQVTDLYLSLPQYLLAYGTL